MRTPILLLALAASACLVSAGDVTGTWKADFDTQIGLQKYTFTLKQDDTNVTGKANAEVNGEKREADLKEGKLDGDTVSFLESSVRTTNRLSLVQQKASTGRARASSAANWRRWNMIPRPSA